jgi:hypothetical protein
MGKKRKIIAYPQRFDRKFAKHPATRARNEVKVIDNKVHTKASPVGEG